MVVCSDAEDSQENVPSVPGLKAPGLKAIEQSELNQSATIVSSGDSAELRGIDVLIGPHPEGRMVEDVLRVHAQIDALALGDLRPLDQRQINIEIPGT